MNLWTRRTTQGILGIQQQQPQKRLEVKKAPGCLLAEPVFQVTGFSKVLGTKLLSSTFFYLQVPNYKLNISPMTFKSCRDNPQMREQALCPRSQSDYIAS